MTIRTVQIRGPLCIETHQASVTSAELGVIYSPHNQMTDPVTKEIKRITPAFAVVSFRLGMLVKGQIPSFYMAHNLAGWLDRLVDWKATDLQVLQDQCRAAVEAWAKGGGWLGPDHQTALQVRG